MFLKFIIIENRSRMALMKNYLRPFYSIFVLYIFFLIIWGFIWGYDIKQITFILSYASSFLLFFTLPRVLNVKLFNHFNAIIFLFSILLTVTSFFDIMTGGLFRSLISFGSDRLAGTAFDEGLIRQTGGILLSLYSMVFGLYYLVNRENYFKRNYLGFVVLFSWLFILNSATRGWMIASIFLLFSFFILYGFKSLKTPKIIVPLVAILLVVGLLLPAKVTQNLDAAFDRLSTVEAVAEGDMTAGGTASRWDVRGPRVLTRFNESPIFGFGYSKVTSAYFDGHVGNHSLLLVGGYVGFAILYSTFLFIVLFFFRLNYFKVAPGFYIFSVALLCILIIHSTSRNMISFLLPTDTAFFIGLLFNYANAYLYEQRVQAFQHNSN